MMTPFSVFLVVGLLLAAVYTVTRRSKAQYASMAFAGSATGTALFRRTAWQWLESQVPLMLVTLLTIAVAVAGHVAMTTIFPGENVMALVVSLSLLITIYLILIDISHLSDRKFEQQLVEAIDVMRSALDAHLGMRNALQLMADSSNGKLKSELKRMLDRYDAGQSVDANVRQLLSKQNGSAVRMFCHALAVYDEDGVDLSHLLNETARLLRERLKNRHQIETQLAGTKYAAIFAGVLPYLLIPIFTHQEPAWFASLTSHPWGAELVTAGVLMQTFGALWLRHSTRVKL